MRSEDSVVLATFSTRPEVDLAVEILRSEGIESVVIHDDGGGTIPALDLTRGVRLLVAREDEEKARRLLEAMEDF
jgi:hypothetical protein